MTETAGIRARTGPKPQPRFPCVVADCGAMSDHPTASLCHKHYAQIRRTGKPERTYREPGQGTITTYGYVSIGANGKKKQEHVLVAEAAIGHELPECAEVHHVNGVRSDNSHSNLVVCPSRAYHKLLHQRQTSLDACGNPDFRKCPFCKQYDDPKSMNHNKSSRYFYHNTCKTKYRQERAK